MTDLQFTLSLARAAERRDCVRRLLTAPLLGQRDAPEIYAAVVRNRRELIEWFAEHTGWQLVVDETGGVVRLHKTTTRPDASRPARTGGREARPFNRRRYVLVCLVLAALDDRAGQTTLRHLAEAVTVLSAEQAGVDPFDGTRYADRRAFVDALRLLAGLGVVSERDGDAERYASAGSADALFDVDDRRIAQLISAPASPSLVADPADLPVEAYPDTDDGQRLRARHGVVRRLLDDPVVYIDDLDDRQQEWLAHSLGFVHDLMEEGVGLLLERRAEGLLAVDADREVTDETFPDGGSTVKHAALLLAEQLTARVRAARTAGSAGDVVLPQAEVEAICAELVAAFGERCDWSAPYRQDDVGPRALAADALALLARFDLCRQVTPGRWSPRPAIARFAAAAPGSSGQAIQTSLLS